MGQRHGFSRPWKAARYTWQGLKACYREEEAFRQELLACLLLVPAAFWLGETPLQQALLLASLVLILLVELLNSAIEAVVDRFGGEQHELSGRAKDMGSAAVAAAILIAVLLWAGLAWQRFL